MKFTILKCLTAVASVVADAAAKFHAPAHVVVSLDATTDRIAEATYKAGVKAINKRTDPDRAQELRFGFQGLPITQFRGLKESV